MTQRAVIVGGGMVGLAFAVAIKTALPDASVTLLEARPLPEGNPNPLDTRASAINLAGRDVLGSFGVWPALEPAAGAIETIHVSNFRHFGSCVMTAKDSGESRLGYVVENHNIGRALKSRGDALDIGFEAPASVDAIDISGDRPRLTLASGEPIDADLIVIADGAESALRRDLGIGEDVRSTGQWAIVANCEFNAAPSWVAYERFTPNGPMALLPLPSPEAGSCLYNLVWSMPEARAHMLTEASDADFIAALQQDFGWRMGKVMAVGKRSSWQLNRVRACEQFRPGILVVGNAAHGIHPVAGQGFNLSLRDAASLADILRSQAGALESPGAREVLASYSKRVDPDQRRIVAATDLLATLFDSRGVLLDAPRNAALAGLDLVPAVRRKIARMGTGLDTPDTSTGTAS